MHGCDLGFDFAEFIAAGTTNPTATVGHDDGAVGYTTNVEQIHNDSNVCLQSVGSVSQFQETARS